MPLTKPVDSMSSSACCAVRSQERAPCTDRTLQQLITRCARMLETTPAPSEIDTQVLLIEPVLALAGWRVDDVGQMRRANRSAHMPSFDIELRVAARSPWVTLALECKAVRSPEFNTGKWSTRRGIGGLVQEIKNSRPVWSCKARDGAGQLRAYCANLPQYQSGQSVPVLTNGVEWVVFNTLRFTETGRLLTRLMDSDVLARARLDDSDFQKIIIDTLRPPDGTVRRSAIAPAV